MSKISIRFFDNKKDSVIRKIRITADDEKLRRSVAVLPWHINKPPLKMVRELRRFSRNLNRDHRRWTKVPLLIIESYVTENPH